MRPVSKTCETWDDARVPCGKPAVRGYPAMGGGYHMMCDEHSQKHLDYCVTLDEAKRGVQPNYGKRPEPIRRVLPTTETPDNG